MKFFKYLFVGLICLSAFACSDPLRGGGDEDDDPIIIKPPVQPNGQPTPPDSLRI
jgi:hypothetical protein